MEDLSKSMLGCLVDVHDTDADGESYGTVVRIAGVTATLHVSKTPATRAIDKLDTCKHAKTPHGGLAGLMSRDKAVIDTSLMQRERIALSAQGGVR